MRQRLISAFAAAALAASCGTITPPPATVSGPTSTTTSTAPVSSSDAPPEPEPTRGETRQFEEGPCVFDGDFDVTVTCGVMTVPVDRAQPDKTTTLEVAVFEGDDAADGVPTVYLHGGPGSGVLLEVPSSFDQIVAPFVQIGPVIVFDQRGSGVSDPPPACPSMWVIDSQLTASDADHDDIAEEFLSQVKRCRGIVERAGFQLEHYNSLSNAADVADLVETLGFDEVNLYGGSYGSRLAQTIVRVYPDMVRAAALSGVYPTSVDLSDGTSRGLQAALDHVFSACAADIACNAAFGDLETLFVETYDELNRSPHPLLYSTVSGEPYHALIDGDDYVSLLFNMLYESDAVASLPQLMHEVADGGDDLLWRFFEWFGFGTMTNFWQTYASVQCSDDVSLRGTDWEAPDLGDALLSSDGLPGLHGALLVELCESWPHSDAPDVEGQVLETDVPILLLNGEFDPITPASWAIDLHERLPSSRLVLLPHRGHDVLGDFCVQRLVIEFLERPSVPVDPSCGDSTVYFRTDASPALGFEVAEFTTIEGAPYELDAPTGWVGYWIDGGSIYYRDRDYLDETAIAFSVSTEPRAAETAVLEAIDMTEIGSVTFEPYWDDRRLFAQAGREAHLVIRIVDGVEYAFGMTGYEGDDFDAREQELVAMFESVVGP